MARSFRILGTLGSGAFGEVLLTEIRSDDDFIQTLAVKWLHARHSDDPELAGRLRDEARLLGLLQHPNVVRVQGLTRLDGRLAVLMEPVVGRDLSNQHLPPRAVAEVVAAVADALAAAWDTVPPGRSEPLRVVHRDIKPSNVMVTPRGEVKVMDFGVARATFEAREAQTRSQQYGTARYMAPERWLEGIAEAPSDVFSLGVTLIELAGGEPVGRPRLSREGFDADLGEALDRLSAWPELRELAAQMVRFSPADRPGAREVRSRASALDLPGSDLRAWSATLPSAEPHAPSPLTGTVVVEETGPDTFALGTTAGRSMLATATAPISATQPTSPPAALPDPPRSSRGAWAIGLVGAGAIGLLALGWTQVGPPRAALPESTIAIPGPSEPTPSPVPSTPLPLPAPVSVAAPATAPAPVSAPTPVLPRPVTPPEPIPEPVPEPDRPIPQVPVTFMLDPGLTASTAFGVLDRPRKALMVPADTMLQVEVDHPDGSFRCTIPVGSTPATYRLAATRTCTQER
jgi:serine/threonine protein kinase